ncbi:protein PHYTOCHROME KINASE SUBSTRATE 3-like [Mercurialis annua]|uniref:protein PHYTOCHROME KINASE SUBSTRATE 3-like n=1 Tax=Mercurialis annua TaxID=3986 RepID=UPI0021605222|nr:protein PHYTOCHROME KINASE SUBSTRATE 3-like [Mercurialis annua]
MDGESKISDLRDASFAYLTKAQQSFVVKLTESSQFPHPDVSFAQQTRVEQDETSVFGAEKYFNMKIEEDQVSDKPVPDHTIENRRVSLERMRSKSRLGTPSVNSESSWNSQTALLPSSKISLPETCKQKRVNQERWFFPVFSCKGSCSDDKSASIDHTNANAHQGIQAACDTAVTDGKKQSQSRFLTKDDQYRTPSLKREDYFVLPTVNSGVQNLPVNQNLKIKQKAIEEDPRKSIEVFGSHKIKAEDIASNLERKLSVLTWDAIPFPKAQNLPTNNSGSSQIFEDGAESDVSSDLFEIENISCSTQPIYTKQNCDGITPAGCVTPVSRYAPSETSIAWSVVTASAADFSAAEFDEKKVAEMSVNSGSTPRIRRANSLLGCKNQKAVEVAESTYKRNEKGKAAAQLNHHRRRSISSENSMQVRRLSGDSNKVKDYEFS